MRATISLVVIAVAVAVQGLRAQAPTPVVVQAASQPAAPAAQPAAQAPAVASGTLQLLNAMKAANAETLKKQEATLLQLDELQKAADQIKIYTKRG